MNASTNQTEDRNRVMASVALATDRRGPGPVEPDEADWQAFLDGKLDAARSEAMLEYIDSNPDAYRKWLSPRKTRQNQGLGSMFHRLGDAMREGWMLTALSSGAVAALAVVMVLRPAEPLDVSYGQVAEQIQQSEAAPTADLYTIPELDGETGLGFSGGSGGGAVWKAFSAGLGEGRRQLEEQVGASSAGTSIEAPAGGEDYYRLGRWYYLSWFVSRTGLELETDFWAEQKQTLESMRPAFEPKRGAIHGRIDDILAALDKLSQSPESNRSKHQLQRRLRSLWETLLAMDVGS